MNNIDQLREQQKTIQTQLDAAERTERERKQRERDDAINKAAAEKARLKEHTKRGISQGIANELMKQFPGTKVTFDEGVVWPRIFLDGEQTTAFTLNYTEQRARRDAWDRAKDDTGKYYVVVETGVFHTPEWFHHQKQLGRHGKARHENSVKRFSPRKDGTHAYEAIGTWLAHLIMKQKKDAATAEVQKVNKTRSSSLAQDLVEELGGRSTLNGHNIAIYAIDSDSDKVRVTFAHALTRGETTRVVQALMAALSNP